VDTDHNSPPFVFVVVRNIGKGAARDITFQFSAPLESPESAAAHSLVIPVNEQLYFQQGMDYLAPGAEILCL
jgi:ABC-type oligopeptide transport system substrate-binding subunit